MEQVMSEPREPFGSFQASGPVRSLISATRALPGGWFAKRLGFGLRRLAILLLKGRPVDLHSFGARFRLYPYNNVCEKRILFAPQDFDAAERAFLQSRIRPNFVFLDVGANVGGYCLAVAAMAGADARILAIEPQPEIFDRLAFNIAANPFGTVKALALAIADRELEMTLFLDPGNKGEASVRILNTDLGGMVRVPGRPLLAVIEQEGFDHVDAIKLDVEGAEDLILTTFFAAARPALWPRILIIERAEGRWSVDLVRMLEARGYRTQLRTRNNHVLERLA